MNKHCLLSCALFLCFVAPCAAQTPAVPIPLPPMTATAAESLQNYAQALVSGTPAEIAGYYDGYGQLLLPGMAPITGPEAIEKFLVPLVKQAKVTSVTVKTDWYQGGRNTWTLWGTYSETYTTPDGKAQTVTGRFASVWQTGLFARWRIDRLMMHPAPVK